jgi:hypothetical protein
MGQGKIKHLLFPVSCLLSLVSHIRDDEKPMGKIHE